MRCFWRGYQTGIGWVFLGCAFFLYPGYFTIALPVLQPPCQKTHAGRVGNFSFSFTTTDPVGVMRRCEPLMTVCTVWLCAVCCVLCPVAYERPPGCVWCAINPCCATVLVLCSSPAVLCRSTAVSLVLYCVGPVCHAGAGAW